jgi:hypothetical protein
LRFCTSRRTRKVADIERTGNLTIAYATDTVHVSLVGKASINDDVATKQAGWTEAGYRWFPKGPTDPDVVYVEFRVDQIEIWSSSHGLLPDPAVGLWAYQLIRTPAGWSPRTTLPELQTRPSYFTDVTAPPAPPSDQAPVARSSGTRYLTGLLAPTLRLRISGSAF